MSQDPVLITKLLVPHINKHSLLIAPFFPNKRTPPVAFKIYFSTFADQKGTFHSTQLCILSKNENLFGW